MTWTYAFDEAPALDRAALKALLGGKGANLAVMANELGLPVPPGFIVTWRKRISANMASSIARYWASPTWLAPRATRYWMAS